MVDMPEVEGSEISYAESMDYDETTEYGAAETDEYTDSSITEILHEDYRYSDDMLDEFIRLESAVAQMKREEKSEQVRKEGRRR